MAGLIFAISIISILTTVGFLFAWMVRLASNPEVENKLNQSAVPDELPTNNLPTSRPSIERF